MDLLGADELKHRAGVLRALMVIGLISTADVVAWVDETILALDQPPEWLLQLALVRPTEPQNALIHGLGVAPGSTDPGRVCDDISRACARALARRPELWRQILDGITEVSFDGSLFPESNSRDSGGVFSAILKINDFVDYYEDDCGDRSLAARYGSTHVSEALQAFVHTSLPGYLAKLPALAPLAG